jgi:DDE_Tnp_1-associated
MENPLKYFAELRDPGIERNREHLLEEILLIAIAAVLSAAESWNDLADYGKSKREWLKTFLILPSGIPSDDTFNRVIAALDPEEMEKGFVDWVRRLPS